MFYNINSRKGSKLKIAKISGYREKDLLYRANTAETKDLLLTCLLLDNVLEQPHLYRRPRQV